MKNVIFLLLCISANTAMAQVKIGIAGGYTSAKYVQTSDRALNDLGIRTSPIHSYHAGLVTDVKLGNNLSLRPSLLYTVLGTQNNGQSVHPGITNYYSSTIKLSYLKLPIELLYEINGGKNLSFVIGGGMYVAKGLSGTEKGERYYNTTPGGPLTKVPIDNKVAFTYTSSSAPGTTIKEYDYGCSITGGIVFKQVQLSANLSHGFSKIYSNTGFNYKNFTAGVSAAYLVSIH
ncbi:MAG: outer membrane beta-barrel protein [Ferruginibacter sp.]